MHDHSISQAAVIATILWSKAILFVVLVWALAVLGIPSAYHRAAALTAVLGIAFACVWQIRLYMLRLSSLIRVANGLETPDADVAQLVPRRT